MNRINHDPAGSAESHAQMVAELERLGVVTVPSAKYEWGGFSYSNPRDALAAARRGTQS